MGQEISAFADRHVGKDSDLAKNTKAFADRHFGKDSDLKKNLDNLQKKLPFNKAEVESFVGDDRLFSATKEALKARPPMKYPSANASKKEVTEWWKKMNKDQARIQGEWSGLPPTMNSPVTRIERMVQGVNVCITRKKDNLEGPVVVYLHGGGFAAGSFNDHAYKNYTSRLAALGKCIVISVDYASSIDKSFADALDDCTRVTQSAASGKITGVKEGPVLLAGNSTGGMLALATAIKANREGWIKNISGIYTISPFADAVFNEGKYPSMSEFNGYNISEEYLKTWLNSVKNDMEGNPKMFPIDATKSDLKGLPPTKIVVFQLDMLRDMGIAMHFKLMKAGVEASFNIVSGGVHDQQLFYNHSPEVTESSINDLAQFSVYTAGKAVSGLVKAAAATVSDSTKADDDKSVRSSTSARSSTSKGRSRSPSAKVKYSTTKSSSVKSTEKLISKKIHVESDEVSDTPDDRSVKSNRSTRSSSSKKGGILSRPPPSLPEKQQSKLVASSGVSVDSTVATTVAPSAR